MWLLKGTLTVLGQDYSQISAGLCRIGSFPVAMDHPPYVLTLSHSAKCIKIISWI